MSEPEILGPCEICGGLIDDTQGRNTDCMFAFVFCYRCVSPEDEAAAKLGAAIEASLEGDRLAREEGEDTP